MGQKDGISERAEPPVVEKAGEFRVLVLGGWEPLLESSGLACSGESDSLLMFTPGNCHVPLCAGIPKGTLGMIIGY